ncbi:hypothetical protein Tco_0790670 [Tanacetum coccineum]
MMTLCSLLSGGDNKPRCLKTFVVVESIMELYMMNRPYGRMILASVEKMPLEQFQVNTKFLNTLSAEWSKFFIDVKLVKDLHTTNVDQIHAYLEQHE